VLHFLANDKMIRVGQNHIYIQCMYGIFGRETTKYRVIYGIRCIYTVRPTNDAYAGVRSKALRFIF